MIEEKVEKVNDDAEQQAQEPGNEEPKNVEESTYKVTSLSNVAITKV